MGGKLLFDLLGQDRDLLNEAGQGGHQRDMGVRGALLAGGAAGAAIKRTCRIAGSMRPV